MNGGPGAGAKDCPHGTQPERCPICCLQYVRNHEIELHVAVTGPRDVGNSGDFVSGGAPSWEPISLAAYALLQDITRAGGLDVVERDLNTLTDPDALHTLHRSLRSWRNRTGIILGLATAPYTLTWDVVENGRYRVRPVPCPVVSDQGDCAAPLRVHRDDDPKSPNFTRPALIRCVRRDDHEWTIAHGGWLRLGVLLGGVA